MLLAKEGVAVEAAVESLSRPTLCNHQFTVKLDSISTISQHLSKPNHQVLMFLLSVTIQQVLGCK